MEASKLQQDAGVSDPTSIHINCYLVQGRGRTILIDAGAGGFKQWGGKLIANLALAGMHLGELGFGHIKRKGTRYEILYEA